MGYSKKILGSFVLFIGIAIAISSCKKEEDEEVTPENTFDKSGMLTNYADSIIVPQYQKFKQKTDSLKLLTDAFVAAPNLSNLAILQDQFLRTYEHYQWVSTFEFGPAETDVLRANFNTFPCDTTQVNANIVAGTYDLSIVSNIDAKGFPALDFLLFGINRDDNYILSLYTSSLTSSNAKGYLTALVNELQLKSTNVYNSWLPSGGGYTNTFKNNTGSDVGSSIGMLVNQLNFDFELLKNARIGIPLGKRTLGIPLPEKVEAYYSQHSLELVMQHIQNIENVYLGRSISNNNGLGLDDYLSHINAQYAGGSLDNAIKAKFTSAKTKLLMIPGTLSQAVVTDATIVDQAYAELLQLVVLLKVDMPSALGVLITYQDNDGD